MKDCIFCKIVSREVQSDDIFFEDDKVLCMLDIDWVVKGHTLVVWKEHALNMSDLSEVDFSHFSETCRKTEKRLLEVLSVDKSVVLKSGGLEEHFHFHIYPVRSDTPWETVRYMFEKKTKYKSKAGEREELLASLREI